MLAFLARSSSPHKNQTQKLRHLNPDTMKTNNIKNAALRLLGPFLHFFIKCTSYFKAGRWALNAPVTADEAKEFFEREWAKFRFTKKAAARFSKMLAFAVTEPEIVNMFSFASRHGTDWHYATKSETPGSPMVDEVLLKLMALPDMTKRAPYYEGDILWNIVTGHWGCLGSASWLQASKLIQAIAWSEFSRGLRTDDRGMASDAIMYLEHVPDEAVKAVSAFRKKWPAPELLPAYGTTLAIKAGALVGIPYSVAEGYVAAA